jgi:hypothetical protein
MGVRFFRRGHRLDQGQATRDLLQQGVYRVEVQDREAGLFRTSHVPFSFWSSVKYIFVLSVLLWWIPTFGQMIAGYVGGRRAGSRHLSILAAILPVLVIWIFAYAADQGTFSAQIGFLASIPSALGGWFSATVPPASPYVAFAVEYFATFVAALQATLAMGLNGYLVTIVFAYIGGIVAEQTRQELEFKAGTSMGVNIVQSPPAPVATPPPSRRRWQGGRPEHFEDYRPVPVVVVRDEPEPPVRAKRARAKAKAATDDEEAPKKTRPKRRGTYDKDAATRRFVERALRQYEAASRR